MTLSDLAAIGNFVSGIAVVVSLVYLALQVRHAQRTQQAFMHQARVERVTNVSTGLAAGDVSNTIAKAWSGGSEFSPGEIMQLFYVVRIQVLAVDDALWQHDAGFLDEPSLQTTILTMRRLMANPVLRAVWYLVRPQVAPPVRARIEKIVDETPISESRDWAAQWRAEYDTIVAARQPP